MCDWWLEYLFLSSSLLLFVFFALFKNRPGYPFIDRIDLLHTKTFAQFNKQRWVERGRIAETGIAYEVLHVHVFTYLLDGFSVTQITNMFDNQTAKRHSGIDAACACPVVAHLFLVDIHQNVPRYLPGHHYPAVFR